LFFLKSLIKILYLAVLLFFLSCDFRLPQKWETPEWEFDLNVPLINETYSMGSIASASNDIEVSSDSTNFIVSISERIIEPGTIVTNESFFTIAESNLALSLDNIINISNPNPMPSIASINESIAIGNLLDITIEEGSCIPKNPLGMDNGYDTTIVIDIDSFCDNISDNDCLEVINSLAISSGNNSLIVNNKLPFIINQLDLSVSSDVGSFISNNLTDIDGLITDETLLDNQSLGCEVNASLYFKIDTPFQASSNSEDCNLCDELGYLPIDDECYIPITLTEDTCPQIDNTEWNEANQECRLINDLPEFSCNDPLIWDSDLEQCYVVYELNSSNCQDNGWQWLDEQNGCYLACSEQEECCELITGNWENGQCSSFPSFEGFKILSNPDNLSLDISNEINLNSFESINVEIQDCEIPEFYSFPLLSDSNIKLIEGHISNIVAPDTNRIIIDLTNNLFTNIYANINSSNLIDPNGDSLMINIENIQPGESFDDIILSNYTIKNLEGDPVDSLEMNFQINIPDQITDIPFDTPYGLSGNGINIKTTKLEEIKVNLNQFSSPDINMGSVPSGLSGFDLPFLTFKLNMYNQISSDMKLFLDLYGINDDDTLKIHVEPDINFLNLLDPYSDTDSLTISFYKDTMSVEHRGNGIAHTPAIKTIMEHKITDLFAYDIIDVSGYAIMDGDATLLPNKSLWGDIEIIIHPLTFTIDDSENFNFVAGNFTELSVMDENIATKIDSGLISATINMNLNNKLPFAGNLLMYISNSSNYFPFCIDSLKAGSLIEQEVSDSCKTYIENYLGCQNFLVDTLSGFVKHLDCVTNNDIYYYENLLNIDFPSPLLDDWGNVLDSALNQQEIILDDEVYYFTRNNTQYLIPRFVFNSELDTITLQPDNSLSVNSSILFRLLTTGLLEE
tara:strand:- start:1859 stop:4582 length:2724 start_codon:yes stop_codon:yes gene_type:complete